MTTTPTIPGVWKICDITFTLVAPRIAEAIRWQIQIQSMSESQEELPELTLAAVGLCCKELPNRARGEPWSDYAERVEDTLFEEVQGIISPLELYNRTHEVQAALRGWLFTGANPDEMEEVEEMGNS